MARPQGGIRLALALLLAAAPAAVPRAGNLEKFSLGEDAALTSGAIAATTRDNGAIWYNPAGLAGMADDSVDLDVSAYSARYYRIPNMVLVTLPDGAGSLDFNGSSFFSTPAAVVAGQRLRPGLSVAEGFFTRDQLDLNSSQSSTFTGLTAGAKPYSYEQGVELDFRSKNYLAGVGLGWQPWRWLRLGASGYGEYVHEGVSTKFWGDLIDLSSQYPGNPGLYSNRVDSQIYQRVSVTDWGLRAVAGAQIDLGHGLAAAVVLRSPRYSVYQEIGADFLLDANTTQGPVILNIHVNLDSVRHPYQWEDVYQLHSALAWSVGAWTLTAEGDGAQLPGDQGVGMVWNWKAGALCALADHWTLGAGAYSDYAAVHPLTSFADSNMDYYGASLGLRYRKGIGARNGDPAPVVMSTTMALRYERGTGQVAGVSIDAAAPNFPLPVAVTSGTFEEASLHLASGLSW